SSSINPGSLFFLRLPSRNSISRCWWMVTPLTCSMFASSTLLFSLGLGQRVLVAAGPADHPPALGQLPEAGAGEHRAASRFDLNRFHGVHLMRRKRRG